MAETSNRISSTARRWWGITAAQIRDMSYTEQDQLATDIRSMCGSLIRQDETKGLRGVWNVIRRRK